MENMQDVLYEVYANAKTYEMSVHAAKIYQFALKKKYSSKLCTVKRFSVTVDNKIPQLSWICVIDEGNYDFIIGKGVEYGKNYLFEGVWEGDYEKLDFYKSDFFYGSGAFINRKGICRFVPPKVCTDFLYVLHDKLTKKTYVSNSFVFIFKHINLKVEDELFLIFKNNFHRLAKEQSALGADRGDPLILDTVHYSMYSMMYHNFTVDDNGNINFLFRLPYKLEIEDFETYKNFLVETTAKIIENGKSSFRKNKFSSISMLSTGYDSSAVSAIYSKAGGKDAISLEVVTRGHHDCGSSIAKYLNLHCIECLPPRGNVDSLAFKFPVSNYMDIYEFVATAGIGDNYVFKNMEPFFKNRIVFSGLYGDGSWSKKVKNGGLAHHISYMKSRNEFRLRVGYFLVPVPAFGAYFPYVLKKINKLPSMKPYNVASKYNRPIPRRICEEMGVPREMFGIKKAANNYTIMNHLDLFDVSVSETMKRYV